MTLLEQIQNHFNHKNIADVVKALGYKSSKTAKVTQVLTDLINAKDINEYLDKSYFDFKYTSRSLLQNLCRMAGISKIDYALTIEAYEDKKRILEAIDTPYIFVDTHFKRKGETLISLALLEDKRRMPIDKTAYLERSEEENLAYVSNAVKLHFKWRGGKLPLWGKIKAYLYYDGQGKRTVFDCLGDVIETDDICESRASVKLGNKPFI